MTHAREVRILEEAVADLVEIVAHLGAEGAPAVARFRRELEAVRRLLEAFPESGPCLEGSIRSRPLRSLPYSVHYVWFEESAAILVLGVMHHRRSLEELRGRAPLPE